MQSLFSITKIEKKMNLTSVPLIYVLWYLLNFINRMVIKLIYLAKWCSVAFLLMWTGNIFFLFRKTAHLTHQ